MWAESAILEARGRETYFAKGRLNFRNLIHSGPSLGLWPNLKQSLKQVNLQKSLFANFKEHTVVGVVIQVVVQSVKIIPKLTKEV